MVAAKVVIGANYGDEGKGLITDYLSAKYGADFVIRFNGGAQAGHTVVTPAGIRHVFSHFSSGTFAGAATYLSQFFVVNPLLYFKERESLEAKCKLMPRVVIHPRCQVTTPYDMMINQTLESYRGADRHGSCGVGFGETIERCLDTRFRIEFSQLSDKEAMREILCRVRDEYLPARCKSLGIPTPPMTDNQEIFENFLSDCDLMFHQVETHDISVLTMPISSRPPVLVFEGAQGLLLDQDMGVFPHVTRSNTGLQNVLQICNDAGIGAIEVTYVTRAYLTRHGAGPLDGEVERLSFANVEDQTNTPNTFQGSLRFAPLNQSIIEDAILSDLERDGKGVKIKVGLAVTCLDQTKEFIEIYLGNGEKALVLKKDFAGFLGKMIQLDIPTIKSYGTSRDMVFQDRL